MTQDEKNWGMFCHVAVFIGVLIPLGNVIGPLVIWLMKRDEYAFVADQGKEVLNFQITVLIAMFVSAVLTLVFIGFLLLGIVCLLALIFTIVGIINSSNGEMYRYPFAIRLIK